MEADLNQIKILLWAVLGLQVVFVAGNILCRVLGCGERKHSDYQSLLDRGKLDELLDKTKRRLDSHPRDIDALYFRAKALIASGLTESGRTHIERLMIAEPALIGTCKEWLDAIDGKQSGGS